MRRHPLAFTIVILSKAKDLPLPCEGEGEGEGDFAGPVAEHPDMLARLPGRSPADSGVPRSAPPWSRSAPPAQATNVILSEAKDLSWGRTSGRESRDSQKQDYADRCLLALGPSGSH